MIVVTGAAGFIGSCLITELQRRGYADLVAVDDFSVQEKASNLLAVSGVQKVERNAFAQWLRTNQQLTQFVFHIGARTNTAEFDMDVLNRLNLDYTKEVWNICTEFSIPLIYASSAATYGMGENGFDDNTSPEELTPLNPYGVSKNEFDKWMLKQNQTPPFWAGFKFFNVYGPNEYHKGRMASVILHAFNQIQSTNKVKLFQSHNPNFKDGEQERDFIYVKDVLNVLIFMMEQRKYSGLYNLGTGQTGTFLELTQAVFDALDKPHNIEYIPTPIDIRDKYQYYTCANMTKLRKAGYLEPFTSLRNGAMEYVSTYLKDGKRY
ncbi:MAG: ADP-glyceromanno-heptose 6-epimerase [Bacteroidia bacterium]|nr:ADP-glyceromanno-heptose 6-epimerase [Bacteroidota bacterium]MCZ2129459.1 ADP-glyceromanno-heptose 6-epimerase [Bacteroidia bacterium]